MSQSFRSTQQQDTSEQEPVPLSSHHARCSLDQQGAPGSAGPGVDLGPSPWLSVFTLSRHFTFTFTFHFHALEKEMATHSSVLAWRIPGTGEPGGLPSMGSQRVGHD